MNNKLKLALAKIHAVIIILAAVIAIVAGIGYYWYQATAKPQIKEIKIGAVYPLTGPVLSLIHI